MLELKNICKTYRPKKGVPVQALKNVSLKFTEKGMVFILGKSGCGKSTLLNCIGGLDKFDSGELIIKGKSSKDFSGSDFDSYRNTFIGFIFQEYNILSEFNVEKNIALALELQGKKATKEKVNELLAQVDLSDQGKRKTNELSGGQKQRIAIARALIKDPEIIIADEPTGALDSATGKQVFDTLKKLSADKLVIIVSHDREFAETYADRIIEMKDGVVVSDETKRHIQGQKLNDGISVIGDDVIHIKAGHEVTPKEVEFLTKYIAKRDNSEAFISLNPNTNKKFREIAKIDDDNAAEKFDKTTVEDLQTPIYNRKDLKLIRSRLKFKDSFKMGASSLKSKPVRLVFTILLSFIAFAMFGLVDTLAAFSPIENTARSIVDTDIRYLSIIGKKQRGTSGSYYYEQGLLTKTDIESASDAVDVTLKEVYNYGSAGYSSSSASSLYDNFQTTSSSSYYGYYADSIAGFCELTKNQLEQMGCSLLYQDKGSSYPTNQWECLITSYQLEAFIKNGYQDYAETDISKKYITGDDIKNDPSILLGKTLRFNSGAQIFTICGIIETGFDSERYASLKSDNNNFSSATYMLSNELRILKMNSIHNIIVVPQGTINNILTAGSESLKAGLRLNGYIQLVRETSNSYSSYETIKNIATPSQIEEVTSNVKFYTKSGSSIIENNVCLPINSIGNVLGGWSNYENITKSEMLTAYNDETLVNEIMDTNDSISIPFYNVAGFGNTSNLRVSVLLYLLSNSDGYEVVENENYNKIFQLDVDMIVDYIQNLDGLELTYADELNNSEKTESAIVGFYYEKPQADGSKFFDNYAILGDDIYRTLKAKADSAGVYSFALGVMPTDEKAIRQIASFHNKNLGEVLAYDETGNGNSNTQLLMVNEVTNTMDEITSFAKELSRYFLYLGIGLCVFASLMMMNFIATSISYKKREIGILRALGSRKSDVFGIFFNESLVIAFINFILAFVAGGVVTGIINNSLRSEYGILITIFNFGIRQILLILVVSVLVAFISSLIPVINISKKQPIDAINNR